MKLLDKKCEECGHQMSIYGVKRIQEKRFCSHSCCAKFNLRTGVAGIIQKGDRHSEETCERFREIGKTRNMKKLSHPVIVSRWLIDRGQSPQERQLEIWLKEANLTYRYTGDGKLCIGGFWPDFIHSGGEKIIIEFSEPIRNERKSEMYAKLGYTVVFVSRYLVQYGGKDKALEDIRKAEVSHHANPPIDMMDSVNNGIDYEVQPV